MNGIYSQQILDECLNSLAHIYQQQNIPRIRSDVLNLIGNVPTLTPKVGKIMYQNGREVSLLTLSGTIPMYYKGGRYNIPMNFFIVEMYPYHPPMCFVAPSENMIIKPRHRHVNSQGLCYLPYLSQWNAQVSNLYELVNNLSAVFGQEPPVFQKTSSTPSSDYSTQTQNINSPVYMMTSSTTPPPPMQTQSPITVQQPQINMQTSKQQMKDNIKRQLIAKIEYKLRPLVEETTKNLKAEMDTQDELNVRAQKLDQLDLQMTNEEKQMDNDIETLRAKLTSFDLWIQNHEKKDIDVDKAIEPEDIYSKQILDLMAEENAIEDFFYYLDKALQYKTIDLETYLNHVREASRQQFMKKALLKKISIAQQQK
jgi:ESCRT-I complex subunit TSG101